MAPLPLPLVVVVEDDAGSRHTLARVLRTGGFAAALYASAEEFLSERPAGAIGILIDLHLGGMSGLELQEFLNREGSTVPVIVTTGLDDPRLEGMSRQLGCRAFLRKPCEARAILLALHELDKSEGRERDGHG
jgi:FixJ family two-component response regulator